MVDEPKTDGTGITDTPTDKGTAQSPPPAGSDSTATSGFEQRIHGLTAEKERAKTELEEMKQKYAELETKHKTDEEKRLDGIRQETRDQVIEAEVEPLKQRVADAEVALTTLLDTKMEQIPEAQRELVPETLPLHERLMQADRVLVSLGSGKGAPNLGGSMNPENDKPKIISGSEFNRWSKLDQYNADSKKEFEALQPEMDAAARENRIDWTR
jgi:hypothetical protein